MPTITQALVLEHAVFRTVFDQLERVLPAARSAHEVGLLATVAEGLLRRHGETEEDLAYSALDHVLNEDGRLDRLHQDHREIDDHFKHVHRATNLAEAQRLLRKALTASREHFRREEQTVFPFLERVLQPETLGTLGESWTRTLSTAASDPPITHIAT